MTIFGTSAATFMKSSYAFEGAQCNWPDESCPIVGLMGSGSTSAFHPYRRAADALLRT